MTYRKAYKENVKKLEELIKINQHYKEQIEYLGSVISSLEAKFEAQEKILSMYKEENMRLKKKPLENVKDLIDNL